MPTAIVTGSPERLSDVTIALKQEGFEILAAGNEVPGGARGLAPGSVDCYVQLPAARPAPGVGAVHRARAMIAEDVLARFDTAARLAPLLAPQATVVLVAGGLDEEEPPRELRALNRLVSVLAEAILRDHGPDGVRTTVVSEDAGAEGIAALARRGPLPEQTPWWTYAALEPELPFTEWRDAVLCQMTCEGV